MMWRYGQTKTYNNVKQYCERGDGDGCSGYGGGGGGGSGGDGGGGVVMEGWGTGGSLW